MLRARVIAMTETAAWRRRHRQAVEAAAFELAQIATIDFDPAEDVGGIVAAALAGMRKADLIALVRRGRGDGSDEKLALLIEDARVVLQAAVDLLEDAAARLEVARAVVALTDD